MTNQLLVLLGYLVCEESLFTCCFKSLSLSLDFDSFMMMCLVSLYEFFFFFFFGFAAFFECADECFSSNLGGFWLFFLQNFFASFYCFSFYKIFSMHMLVCLMMFCRPFFLLCLRLDNLNWPVFKFSDYFSEFSDYFSASSSLLLSPSREYYTSVIVLHNSRISVYFFL